MPEQPQHDPARDPDEGLPWQIIYATFLGVLLCATGIYGGMFLARGPFGWMGVAGGASGIVVSVALAGVFVVLITGKPWSIRICRWFMPLAAAGALAALTWSVLQVVRSPEWNRPWLSFKYKAIELIFHPAVLASVLAAAVVGFMFYLLYGKVTRRYFGR